jgi:hypothetical protein
VKPALAVASALACGMLLPLGTGALLWCLGALAWIVLSVPFGIAVGRFMRAGQGKAINPSSNEG